MLNIHLIGTPDASQTTFITVRDTVKSFLKVEDVLLFRGLDNPAIFAEGMLGVRIADIYAKDVETGLMPKWEEIPHVITFLSLGYTAQRALLSQAGVPGDTDETLDKMHRDFTYCCALLQAYGKNMTWPSGQLNLKILANLTVRLVRGALCPALDARLLLRRCTKADRSKYPVVVTTGCSSDADLRFLLTEDLQGVVVLIQKDLEIVKAQSGVNYGQWLKDNMSSLGQIETKVFLLDGRYEEDLIKQASELAYRLVESPE